MSHKIQAMVSLRKTTPLDNTSTGIELYTNNFNTIFNFAY